MRMNSQSQRHPLPGMHSPFHSYAEVRYSETIPMLPYCLNFFIRGNLFHIVLCGLGRGYQSVIVPLPCVPHFFLLFFSFSFFFPSFFFQSSGIRGDTLTSRKKCKFLLYNSFKEQQKKKNLLQIQESTFPITGIFNTIKFIWENCPF